MSAETTIHSEQDDLGRQVIAIMGEMAKVLMPYDANLTMNALINYVAHLTIEGGYDASLVIRTLAMGLAVAANRKMQDETSKANDEPKRVTIN